MQLISHKQKIPKTIKTFAVVNQASKRKWSDWSECTINCVKVRHRINCDDIVSEQQLNNKTISTTTTTATTTSQKNHDQDVKELIKNNNDKSSTTIDRIITKRSDDSKRKNNFDEQEELLKRESTTSIDDDYADDGDELEADDDSDLCDKVETSKTFEEIPCIGGLCNRLSSIQQQHQNSAINLLNQVTPATTTPSPNSIAGTLSASARHHRHHNNNNKNRIDSSIKQKASLSQNDLDFDNIHQQPQPSQTQLRQHIAARLPQTSSSNSNLNIKQHKHSSSSSPSSSSSDTQASVNRRLILNLNGNLVQDDISENDDELPQNERKNYPSLPVNNPLESELGETTSVSGGSGSGTTNQLQPASIWSKAIWPTKQLFLSSSPNELNSNINVVGPHIILIQWAILIGLLLALILILIILLKKICSLSSNSPSYHWMLAKQMIKSTSNRLGATNCNSIGNTTTTTTTTNNNNNNNESFNAIESALNNNVNKNCYRLAPPPHHKGFNNHLSPFNCNNSSAAALLLAETTSGNCDLLKSPSSLTNIKTNLYYGCHHHNHNHDQNQYFNCNGLNYPINGNATTTTSNSLNNQQQCFVNSNGISSLINNNSQNCKFNLDNLNQQNKNITSIDPPSYIYASMTQSSNSSQLNVNNNNSINLSDLNNNSSNNNYDTLNNIYSNNSLGYDDPANLIPERDKGFILTRDFVILPQTKSNGQLNSNSDANDINIESGQENECFNKNKLKTQSVDRSPKKITQQAIVSPTIMSKMNDDI